MTEPTQSSESPQPPTSNFYLVIVPEFHAPQMLTFDSIEKVAECIINYKEQNQMQFYSFVFEGESWKTTKGPNRYLISPSNDVRVPLFKPEVEDDDIDPSGLIS
jgi:hypothetical protein